MNHYNKIGYRHAYLCDNNEIGDEKFEDVISKRLINNFVTIVDYGEINGNMFQDKLRLIMIVMKKIIKIMIGYLFLI